MRHVGIELTKLEVSVLEVTATAMAVRRRYEEHLHNHFTSQPIKTLFTIRDI